MVLNKTKKDRDTEAELQYQKQLELEKPFINDIRRFFTVINNEFSVIYTITGKFPNFKTYNFELRSIISKHYRSISKHYSRTIRNQLIKKNYTMFENQEDETQKTVDNNIKAAIIAYILLRSKEQSDIILATTDRLYKQAVEAKKKEIISTGKVPKPAKVSKFVKKRFTDNIIPNRSELVGVTETQNIIETTKQIEAEELDKSNVFLKDSDFTKQWITKGDNRVRTWHVLADGQIVKINEPFIVVNSNGSPESLLYPGDTSLGASAENVL